MDYIFGYGSLLSEYSRQHYSNIQSTVLTATLSGWGRAWCVTYPDEGATYAGALRDNTRQLDGVLIPSEINPGITERERGYTFSRLSMDDLSAISTNGVVSESDQIWICETLLVDVATTENPLPQTYVDTCLSGCIESHGVEGAKRFIQQTSAWDSIWVNDRPSSNMPIYPRYTPISGEQSRLIDSLLEQEGVLKFRQAR